MNAVGCVVLLLAGAQAGLRHLDSKARHPTSRIDSSHSRQTRMALVTKCSGKPRISFDQRSELIGAAAQAAGKVPHQGALDETRDTTGSREWKPSPGMLDPQQLIAAWRAVRTPHWPATTGQNLTRMCMVSVCSMINATQPDPGHVDVVSLVDEDTPQHILDMYEKLGVRIVDLSDVSFPPRFNNRSYASSYKVRLWGNETVAEAVRRGHPQFSALPDSFYKLWLWSLSEYSKVFYFDCDTLTVKNATANILAPNFGFTTVMRPLRRYLNAGMMVLEPDQQAFEQMMHIWQSGDYPYRHVLNYGEDDQMFLAHLFFTNRLNWSIPMRMRSLDHCHNDKRGREQCDPSRVTIFHKVPIWEQGRETALWQAAQEGRCLANPALKQWEYSKLTHL